MKSNISKLVCAVVISVFVAVSALVASPSTAAAGTVGSGGGIGGIFSVSTPIF